MNLLGFIQKFNTEELCVEWLATQRWNSVDNAKCPFCNSTKSWHYSNGKMYKCASCKKQFSVRVGTIFEDSRIPLVKWFVAIYLFTSLKKGISSIQLSKYIEVTQKTAWFMLQRIREVMQNDDTMFSGTTEVDEAYIGGKLKNMHMKKRIALKEKDDKAVVVGLVNRETKQAKIMHVANATSQTLQTQIHNNVSSGSVVLTEMKAEHITHFLKEYTIAITNT